MQQHVNAIPAAPVIRPVETRVRPANCRQEPGSDGSCYVCSLKTCSDMSSDLVDEGKSCSNGNTPQGCGTTSSPTGARCCVCTGCSSGSGSSTSSCTSATTGNIPNGSTVCTYNSNGTFYSSYISLSLTGTSYNVNQSGVSTSLVSCSCSGKNTYGTACVLASCKHKYGTKGTFYVSGSF